jgi:hypothetical protein
MGAYQEGNWPVETEKIRDDSVIMIGVVATRVNALMAATSG